MLAGAALAYLRRYGVAVGRRPVFFINNDEAYEALFALAAAGITAAGVADVRPASRAAERARELGVDGAVRRSRHGGARTRRVAWRTARHGRGRSQRRAGRGLPADFGRLHARQLDRRRQLGAPLAWQESIAAFVPELAGRCRERRRRGARGVRACRGGARRRARGAGDRGRAARSRSRRGGRGGAEVGDAELPSDAVATPMSPLWEVSGRGRAFVDLQNDVTSADVRLAHREGYEHVEHMKRYTTHSMATDQGRIGGLLGSAMLAAARGVPLSQVGQVKARPYVQPVPFAALAGAEVRAALQAEAARGAARLARARRRAASCRPGLWLRPLVYARLPAGKRCSRKRARAPRRRHHRRIDARQDRRAAAADAVRFLDLRLRQHVLEPRPSGARATASCCARTACSSMTVPPRGLARSTSSSPPPGQQHRGARAPGVSAASACAALDVALTDVGDQWAQFALAGPRARAVLERLVDGVDVSNAAFPFMAAGRRDASPESPGGSSAFPFPASSRTSSRCRRRTRSPGLVGPARGRRAVRHPPLWPRCPQHAAHREGPRHRGGAQRQHQRGRSWVCAHAEETRRLRRSLAGAAPRTRRARVACNWSGVRPLEPAHRLRNGMQLIAAGAPPGEPRLRHLLHPRRGVSGLGRPRAAHRRPREDRYAPDRLLPSARRAHRGRDHQSAHARPGERTCPRLSRR